MVIYLGFAEKVGKQLTGYSKKMMIIFYYRHLFNHLDLLFYHLFVLLHYPTSTVADHILH